MAKNKIREIEIQDYSGDTYFKKSPDKKYNFEDISSLRKILTKEKVKMLNIIKNENPSSIYDLAKKLKRNFKPVFSDLKLLERFGFIDLVEEKVNNRKRLKPILDADTITIVLKI